MPDNAPSRTRRVGWASAARRALQRNSGSGVPLYMQVAQILEDQIRSGHYAVGSLLPTEMQLTQLLGISRQTVRQAIAQLRDQGLLSARKGVGTRVEPHSAEIRFLHAEPSARALAELARDSELRIMSRQRVTARGRVAAELGCRAGRRWLYLSGPRYMARELTPDSWTEVYVDDRFAAIVGRRDVFNTAIFRLIEEKSGERVAEIEQDIRPATIEGEQGEVLEAVAGSLALLVTRRYLAKGRRLLLMSRNLMPADRFSYSMTFRSQPA